MRLSVSGGLGWMGAGGLVALAVVGASARAQDHSGRCSACDSGQHGPSAHAPATPYQPYLAPVAIERKPHGLIGHLLGRREIVVPAYHQVEGQEPVPINPDPRAVPIGRPPGTVAAPGAKVLVESAPPSAPGTYETYAGPVMAQGLPATGWGEPEPVGVMRTSYDTMPGPSAAAPTMLHAGNPPGAPGHASTAPKGPAYDPSIAMWHTVMPSGGSKVSGGDKRTVMQRLLDGDLRPGQGLESWMENRAERRAARQMSRYYRSTGMLPYQPGAKSVPSLAIQPPR